MELAAVTGGKPGTLLVLLHGLGASRAVWAPMLATAAQNWPGRFLALDLRGHGRSPHGEGYSLADHASDVAEAVKRHHGEGDWVVLGHSMGGAVGLALAGGHWGPPPKRVLGLGIKVAWTDQEKDWLAGQAAAPAKVFDTREAALDRYLKVSGLAGLVTPDSPLAEEGVVASGSGYCLACDPKTHQVGAPPMQALTAAAKAPFHLACGEHDRLVTLDQLREHDPKAQALAGLGHNAMVEAPERVWEWVLKSGA